MVFSNFKIIPIYSHSQAQESSKMDNASRKPSNKNSNQVRDQPKVKHLTQNVYYTTESDLFISDGSVQKREEARPGKFSPKHNNLKKDIRHPKTQDINRPLPDTTRDRYLLGRSIQHGNNQPSTSNKPGDLFYNRNSIMPNVNFPSQQALRTNNSYTGRTTRDGILNKNNTISPVRSAVKDIPVNYSTKSKNSIISRTNKAEPQYGDIADRFAPSRDVNASGFQSQTTAQGDSQYYFSTSQNANINPPAPPPNGTNHSFFGLPLPPLKGNVNAPHNINLNLVAHWDPEEKQDPQDNVLSSHLNTLAFIPKERRNVKAVSSNKATSTFEMRPQQDSNIEALEPTRDKRLDNTSSVNPSARPANSKRESFYAEAHDVNNYPTEPASAIVANSHKTAYSMANSTDNVNSYKSTHPTEPPQGSPVNLYESTNRTVPPQDSYAISYQSTNRTVPPQDSYAISYQSTNRTEPPQDNYAISYESTNRAEPPRGSYANSYKPTHSTELTRGSNLNLYKPAYPTDPLQANNFPTEPTQAKTVNSFEPAYPTEPQQGNNTNLYENAFLTEAQRASNVPLYDPAYLTELSQNNNVNLYEPAFTATEPPQSNNVNSYGTAYLMQPPHENNANFYEPTLSMQPPQCNANPYEHAYATVAPRSSNYNLYEPGCPVDPTWGNNVNPYQAAHPMECAYPMQPTLGNNVNTLEDMREYHPFYMNAANTPSPQQLTTMDQQLYYNQHQLPQSMFPQGLEIGNNGNVVESARICMNNVKPIMQVPPTYNGFNSMSPHINVEIQGPANVYDSRGYNIPYVNTENQSTAPNSEHHSTVHYRDYQRQPIHNEPAIIHDGSFGPSLLLNSVDYIDTNHEETERSVPKSSPRVSRSKREKKQHLKPLSHQSEERTPRRHAPPFIVPPAEVYHYKDSLRLRNHNKHVHTVSSTEELADDDATTVTNQTAIVMNMTAGENVPRLGDGESNYKTKNGRVKCSCGKTMKFSVSVQGNEKNCKACFKQVKRDFTDLISSYRKQGFLPCECKGKLSVTDLVSAYMKDQQPVCNHDYDFKEAHTCSPGGDVVKSHAKTSATALSERPPLKGCKCGKKRDSYKLPPNFVSCKCGGGGGGCDPHSSTEHEVKSPRYDSPPCGHARSKRGGSKGRCHQYSSTEHKVKSSRCDPSPSAPPRSSSSHDSDDDHPRSRSPKDGTPFDARYEKVTAYPTEEDAITMPEPMRTSSSQSSFQMKKKRPGKNERNRMFSESENGSAHSLDEMTSSFSSRGKKHKSKSGHKHDVKTTVYPVTEVCVNPFAMSNSSSTLGKKTKIKTIMKKLGGKQDKKHDKWSKTKTKKKEIKKQYGCSDGDTIYTTTAGSSSNILTQSTRTPSCVSSAEVIGKKRAGVLQGTGNMPRVQKGGNDISAVRKHKHSKTHSTLS